MPLFARNDSSLDKDEEPMPRKDVYDPNAFAYRVDFAASVIARGGQTTRTFDTCFEMNDGEAVAAALVRRARAKPEGNLARNLFRFISEARSLADYEETKHLSRTGKHGGGDIVLAISRFNSGAACRPSRRTGSSVRCVCCATQNRGDRLREQEPIA
jgi:hypothetical protein